MSFAPGDVVQMKSGGPLMTVEKVESDTVVCSWMERSGTQSAPKYAKKVDQFVPVTLVKSGPRRPIGFA